MTSSVFRAAKIVFHPRHLQETNFYSFLKIRVIFHDSSARFLFLFLFNHHNI